MTQPQPNSLALSLASLQALAREAAKEAFMKNPEGNLAKAQAYYSKKHPG
jgi:hypothetical protein